jgi:uncharacterized coiled-coil DUF342 family protein
MGKRTQNGDERTRDQYTVVLEDINSKIDLLVEGHQGLDQKVERLDEKVDGLDEKIDRLDVKFENFKADTQSSFKSVLEYLSRIEDEMMEVKEELKDLKKVLCRKADQERLLALEERVGRLEKGLRQTRLAGAKA